MQTKLSPLEKRQLLENLLHPKKCMIWFLVVVRWSLYSDIQETDIHIQHNETTNRTSQNILVQFQDRLILGNGDIN